MAKSYNKWLGSIEIFMNHVYVFNLITLHYPDVNEVVLVRDLHAQNPSKAVVVHHFQLFLLCLRHVPSFTPIQEMRHNKCVKHLHDAMHSRNNWTLAHRLAVIARTCSHSSIQVGWQALQPLSSKEPIIQPYVPIKTWRLKVESAHVINHNFFFLLTTKENNSKTNEQ